MGRWEVRWRKGVFCRNFVGILNIVFLANELRRVLGRPLTDVSTGFAGGSVSTGFIQATPGDMKSFRSSVERIALIFVIEGRTACMGVWLAKPLGWAVVMDKRSRGSRKESIIKDDAPFEDV